MQAQVFQVLSRKKTDLSWPPSPTDFALIESETFPIQKILEEPTISLYCLDPDNEQALFVEVPLNVNLNKAPFYHHAGRATAGTACLLRMRRPAHRSR